MKVTPKYIADQRERGWPDVHPEDYCHFCGEANPTWCTDRETWLAATAAWAKKTGREGILCPNCFTAMHRAATGATPVWRLSLEIP